MASILKVDELQGIVSAGDITVTSEGGAATQSLQQGLAKARVNFDGTGTIAARDSINLSSLTDNGTGDYTVNFSSSFDNATYNLSASTKMVTGNEGYVLSYNHSTTVTSSAMRLRHGVPGTYGSTAMSTIDNNYNFATFHGDLA